MYPDNPQWIAAESRDNFYSSSQIRKLFVLVLPWFVCLNLLYIISYMNSKHPLSVHRKQPAQFFFLWNLRSVNLRSIHEQLFWSSRNLWLVNLWLVVLWCYARVKAEVLILKFPRKFLDRLIPYLFCNRKSMADLKEMRISFNKIEC